MRERPLSEARAVLGLAGPLAVSELGTVGMAIIDTLMVGRLGGGALAALGYGSALQLVALGLLAGTLAGVTPLVARARGAGDGRAPAHLTTANLWLAVLLSVPGVVALMFGGTLARWTGEPMLVSAGATTYLRALAPSVPASLLFVAGRTALDGIERPQSASVIMVCGLVTNAVAAAVLIPRYGLVGAGLATTIARSLMAAAMLYALTRARLIAARAARGESLPRVMLRIVRMGAPIGVHLALELGVFAVAATFAGWFGVATLAAWQVAMNAVQTAFVLALALGSAGAIRLGHALGAGDAMRARLAIRASFRITFGVAALCGLVFAAAPAGVARLYTADAVVLTAATPMFVLAALFTVVDQLQTCGVSLLYGAADTAAAAVIGLGGYWVVGLPLAWWFALGAGWGVSGLWVGLGTGMAMVFVVSAMRLHRCVPRASEGLALA